MNGATNKNIVIFGGTGDLTYRKLMPSLYQLYIKDSIHDSDQIIAIGRREYSTEDYLEIVKDWFIKLAIHFHEEHFEKFVRRIHYVQMDFTSLQEYEKLSSLLCSQSISESLFYLAVAPRFFQVIGDGIKTLSCTGKVKIIVEKPFGETLEQAKYLHDSLSECFGKENIYLIDHYLGKEMIRSIQTIRFTNSLFKNSWNAQNIEYVHILASEEVGVETRASYYDQAGALKDMVQNHLLQLMSYIAMEEPNEQVSIQERQTEVFRQLRKVHESHISENLLLAQYQGYLEEPGVAKDSRTETFACLKLFVENKRWQDVPFYIYTGKRLANRQMNVVVKFKSVASNSEGNILVFRIQPLEGVSLQFNIKDPLFVDGVKRVEMDFCQSCVEFYRMNTPEAYERLIDAALHGDQSWFTSWEQISLSWKYIDELKIAYQNQALPIYYYDKYTHGPNELNQFLGISNGNELYTQFTCFL